MGGGRSSANDLGDAVEVVELDDQLDSVEAAS
jgi:hypothetical protein